VSFLGVYLTALVVYLHVWTNALFALGVGCWVFAGAAVLWRQYMLRWKLPRIDNRPTEG